MQNTKPSKETQDEWNNNDDYWVWGMFYYNKVDKRIFPPKRNKYMGWTLNFANPVSIFATVALIAAIISLGYAYQHYLEN